MKTVAIDTNVLLDFQLGRLPNFPKAKQLFDDCLRGKSRIFIPQIVFPELEWVLRSYYKEPKEKIVEFFEQVLSLEGVIIKEKQELQQSLVIFKRTNTKFTDALIFTQIKDFEPDEFLTFDEDLKRIYEESLLEKGEL